MKQRLANKLKQAAKSNAGMSLAELLVAISILCLVSAGLYMVVDLGYQKYSELTAQSEAQELYSTLEATISNELRFTQKAVLTGEQGSGELAGYYLVDSFFSNTYAVKEGLPSLVSLNSDGNKAEYGQLAIGCNGVYNRLLGTASYPNELEVKAEIYYCPDNNHFRVKMWVRSGYTWYIEGRSFEVRALNKVQH